MQIQQQSSIPDSAGNYYTQVKDSLNYFYLNIPVSTYYGAGSLPAGMGTSEEFFYKNNTPKLLITSDGKQSNTPIVSTQNGSINDYKFDDLGNSIGASSPAMENIVLCMKTNYNSSSIDDFGLLTRSVIPQNFQNIISADIKKAIKPVIDAGMLDPSTLVIQITKDKSSIFAHIQFTDTQSGNTANQSFPIR